MRVWTLAHDGRLRLAAAMVLVLVLSLVLVPTADARKGKYHKVRAAATGTVTIAGNPLHIIVARDGSLQVVYQYTDIPPSGQFYDSTEALADHGLFLWLGGEVYGPDFANHNLFAYDTDEANGPGNLPVPFGQISQSGPTGDGSQANPWVVTTALSADSIQIDQTITYVNGQQYFRMDSQITNAGASTATLTLFHAGDIFLKGSDTGFGYFDSTTGGAGGQNVDRNWFIVFQPITPASRYQEAFYGTIWRNIGYAAHPGAGFNNTIVADEADNGAGLQWSDLSIAAGQSTTISDWVSFGTTPVALPTPTPTATTTPGSPTASPTATATAPTATATPSPSATIPVRTATPTTPRPTSTPRPPEIPEPGSFGLLATGLLGLGGYLAFRVRNLRP